MKSGPLGAKGVYVVFLVGMLFYLAGGLGGCGSSGGSSGSAGLSLTSTIQLPTSTSPSISSPFTKAATDEVAQSGKIVEFYKGADDSKLGQCTTNSSGTCTLSGVSLAEGSHDIFIRVLDTGGSEQAGAILNATVASGTTEITKTVNSAEDLAYQAYLASCERAIGVACAPGSNVSQAASLVAPRCIRDTIVDLSSNTAADDTAGGRFGALLEAHKSNLAQGGVVDMADVLRGDATALSTFGSTFGSVPSLAKAVASGDAASTAATVLGSVEDCLCDDPASFATIAADADYQADPGVYANIFAATPPASVANLTAAALKNVILNAPSVGSGLEYLGNPLGARAMVEILLNGGFDGLTTADDYQKRNAVLFGAGFPADVTEAQRMGVAATGIFEGSNFTSATATQALGTFGPLLGNDEQMMNFVNGGAQEFDNIVSCLGSLDTMATELASAGDAATFLANHPRGESGASCDATCDCVPPLSCSAGLCTGTATVGGACTSNSDCDSANGTFCNPRLSICTYDPTQSTATSGAKGAACGSGSPCGTGLFCLNGMCDEPGSGSGSEVCGDSRCNGSETVSNCPADCGVAGGGSGTCGDGTCQTARSEDTTTCPADCVVSNLPASFTVTRGNNSAENCSFVNTAETGNNILALHNAMMISSQTGSAFTAEIPISQPQESSFDETTAGDITSGSGTKTANSWSVTTTRTYAIESCGAGTRNITFAQTFEGTISPFACTAVSETWTESGGTDDCNIRDGDAGPTTCTATYGSATCTQ